ncbi:MAG TPA: ribonuclease III [Bacteroidales bacterium]|nr:ribonuclease III [Bacteroidales bacterium]HQH18361.1 ribonuclease III [Bacteroidales bacterium]HQI45732.1 ribonuclease III [Bacteroidales bacterium]
MKLLTPIKGLLSKDKKLYEFIKNVFGYYPGNILLYKLALCHKSASIEEIKGVKINNERLEYLGDAILSAITADYLFKKFPSKDEGFLTEMRSRIVSRTSLNKLSEKLGIHKFVNASGNIICRSINGDAFEAFIGAIFLDKGFNFTRKIIINRIFKYHIDVDLIESNDPNFKSRLLEWAQKKQKQIEFKVVGETGNGYKKQYIVNVFIDNEKISSGIDHSIKKAEQNAAEHAFQYLNGTNLT